MKILVLGGDGFCGWPTALRLSVTGHDVVLVDNFVRRRIDAELGTGSLTPIRCLAERLAAWQALSGRTIHSVELDVARDYEALRDLIASERPDAIVHFAEQRSAPYSMKSAATKRSTIEANIGATHNVLVALVEAKHMAHVIHLGTMGIYGYGGTQTRIPEGYLTVQIADADGRVGSREIIYPSRPESIYHLSKAQDQLMLVFYSMNDGLPATILHQGIVWGTQTEETAQDERLINRFDYDGDYGTVVNRFLVQAAAGLPLTVHGSGKQTRAFIHIRDVIRCIELVLATPPAPGARVRIVNQMTEAQSVRLIAERIARVAGANISSLPNPRNEGDSNDFQVANDTVLGLGLAPTLMTDQAIAEQAAFARQYIHLCRPQTIPAASRWR
jgi:UDP-sulfoquinovose synthase